MEHYGVELDRSSVREVVRKQAERADGLLRDSQPNSPRPVNAHPTLPLV